MTRIVVGRESIATRKIRRTQNLPGARADEVFARYGGQSTHKGRRPQPGDLAKPLREFDPYPLQIDQVAHPPRCRGSPPNGHVSTTSEKSAGQGDDAPRAGRASVLRR